jgi:hypothetical protein
VSKYSFPEDEHFFIDRLRVIFASVLLQERPNSKELNPVVQKFIDCLDEFPEVYSFSLSVEIGHNQIICSEEEFGLHCYSWDWHEVFRNQYFVGDGGHHCIYGYDVLTGEDKNEVLSDYLAAIESDINDLTEEIAFEDYS